MKVQSISNQYNSVSFGEIYKSNEFEYNAKQVGIINDIVGKLRQPSSLFDGRTAEAYYKSKYGMDFGIEGCDYANDSIYLESKFGVKTVGTGTEEAITWRDRFKIGIYDEEHPFKIDDIETAIKNSSLKSSVFILPALAVIAGFLGIIGLGIAKCSSHTQKQVKPLIENVDTLINKAAAK